VKIGASRLLKKCASNFEENLLAEMTCGLDFDRAVVEWFSRSGGGELIHFIEAGLQGAEGDLPVAVGPDGGSSPPPDSGGQHGDGSRRSLIRPS
jgi:hypothetical protein